MAKAHFLVAREPRDGQARRVVVLTDDTGETITVRADGPVAAVDRWAVAVLHAATAEGVDVTGEPPRLGRLPL